MTIVSLAHFPGSQQRADPEQGQDAQHHTALHLSQCCSDPTTQLS